MQVEKVNDNNIELIRQFIKRIPSIEEIEEDLLDKMIVLRENENIKGIISYERYLNKGLIRYFIFQKDIPFDDLKKMVFQMIENAKKENVELLLSVVDQKELVNFFENLGFKSFSVKNIYIDETSLGNTIYNKALGMLYKI